MPRLTHQLAVFVALFAASPVVAETMQNEDETTVRIAIGDLDLATNTGIQEMRARVARAADELCAYAPGVRDLEAVRAHHSCRNAVLGYAAPQMRNAIAVASRDTPNRSVASITAVRANVATP